MESNINKSYVKHRKHIENMADRTNKIDYDWLDNNSYDTWRHKQMYSLLDGLINSSDSWLTIGDGRYGSDAHYLRTKGVKNILASDISSALLRTAQNDGFISKYKEINAEQIFLKDKTFDYVLCKESYHHFPRPPIGLYEMIRVAKKGVVLIEPNDARAFVSRKFENSFETVGNYKYPVSVREVEKISKAMGLYGLAYKGIDDIYLPIAGDKDVNSLNTRIIAAKAKLLIMDVLFKLKLREKSLVCLVIFKENPGYKLKTKIIKMGYKLIVNEKNPYQR